MIPIRISVQAEDFDIAAEVARISAGRTDVGAIVTFTGVCRDEGGTLAALELEHYPGMAEDELTRIAGEAGDKVLPPTTEIGITLLWLSAIFTLYTGWDYFRAAVRHLIED